MSVHRPNFAAGIFPLGGSSAVGFSLLGVPTLLLDFSYSESYQILHSASVTPRSYGYGDATATYIRRSEIPSRIYAKLQYRQESEAEAQW